MLLSLGLCLFPEADLSPSLKAIVACIVLLAGLAIGLKNVFRRGEFKAASIFLGLWGIWTLLTSIFAKEAGDSMLMSAPLVGIAWGAFAMGKAQKPANFHYSHLPLGVGLAALSILAIQRFSSTGKAAALPFFQDSNLMSAALVFVVLLMLPAFFRPKSSLLKVSTGICVIMMATAIVWLQSRGAWLSLLLLLPILPYFFLKSAKWKIAWTMLLIIFATVFIYQNENAQNSPKTDSNDTFAQLQSITDTDQNFSNRERLMRWQIAWRMAKTHPIVGIGTGNYPKTFKFYLKDKNEVSQIAYWNGWKLGAHSDSLNMLAETGFPGLALFLGFLIFSIFPPQKAIVQPTDILWQKRAMQLAILSFLIHGLFNDLLSSPLLCLLFFGAIAQMQNLRSKAWENPVSSF